MTGATDSVKLDKGQSQTSHDVKEDIPYDSREPGVLGKGSDAKIVKLAPKNNRFEPKLRPVIYRKATLRPRARRERKYIDGDRKFAPSDVDFQVPPKRDVENYRKRIVLGAATLSAIAGGAAGSVVPIVGTAIGAGIGFVVGAVGGYLTHKYQRSHSEHRYFQNARKALEEQGVKFTEREKKRLDSLSPQQWEYLTRHENVIEGLKSVTSLLFKNGRWARQYYYQVMVMAVAKQGYGYAQKINYCAVKAMNANAGAGTGVFLDWEGRMAKWGADPIHTRFDIQEPKYVKRFIRDKQEDWTDALRGVQREFGEKGVDHFIKSYARYHEAQTQAGVVWKTYREGKKLRRKLSTFIKPHIAQYEGPVQSRILQLVEKYALEVAAGDIPAEAMYDGHGNLDQKLIEELIRTAARLQRKEDIAKGLNPDDRVPPDVVARRATLKNRISSYSAASNRVSDSVYQRFIGNAADIYDECTQLLRLPTASLEESLRQVHRRVDSLAEVQAAELTLIAGLASRLKDQGVPPDTARMILRMEARERIVHPPQPGDFLTGADRTGWSQKLCADPKAPLPDEDMVRRASDAALQSRHLHAALKKDPHFAGFTERDAERMYFGMISAHRHVGYQSDSETLEKLCKEEFAGLKKILKSGVEVDGAYRALERGARSIDQAIECARLGVDIQHVPGVVGKLSSEELQLWKDKGFSDVEIAAYHHKLMNWKTDYKATGGPLVVRGALSIKDGRVALFRGSGLTAEEANDLLALNFLPADPETGLDLPEAKLRYADNAGYVVDDRSGGEGGVNEVYIQTAQTKNGSTDRRVFKRMPSRKDNFVWRQSNRRTIGSNLGASILSKDLGFDAIVDTQLSRRNKEMGVSMELAKGYTLRQTRDGDVFLSVPDLPRYADLNKAVRQDLAMHGAISDETRAYAAKELKLTRLRMAGDELQASGDFMADLMKDPEFQERIVDLEIVDFVDDEYDRHDGNLVVDLRLGPDGVMAAGVKGIDNDGSFAATPLRPQSIRTMPRVISQRQANAIKKKYENWDDKGGTGAKLNHVVALSGIEKPIKPSLGFLFKHTRADTAADLPFPRDGNQVTQSKARLKRLYDRVKLAESGYTEKGPDGFPPLTIIHGVLPDTGVKDGAVPKSDLKIDSENKTDISGSGGDHEPDSGVDEGSSVGIENDSKTDNDTDAKIDNDDEVKKDLLDDSGPTWGSVPVTNILTNTWSIIAREEMRQR